jgi:hypothetical protein
MAYSLNGTNQRLSVASAPVSAAPWTINLWFKTTNMSQVRCLLALNASFGNHYATIYFRGDLSGDPIQILNGSPGQISVTSTTGCTSGTWHNACYVESSSTSRTIYLDGGSSATNTTSATYTGLDRLNIGAFNALEPFSGEIAQVGIWNAALTADEITSLAKGMACDKVRPQSLVFYAPLIRDLIDAKGGLTITNNNTATVATHPRVYA